MFVLGDHGGNDVYDGAYEWTLLRHVIETEFDIAWMHLRSSERRMDFFVFSSAFRNDKRSTVNEICTRLITAHGVQIRFSMIPKDHVAVLSGHDEGSGCTRKRISMIFHNLIGVEGRFVGTHICDNTFFEAVTQVRA